MTIARQIQSCLAIATLILLTSAHAARAQWQVWTTNQTVRVLREDAPPAGASPDVHLAVARNESRGFQVLMRSDTPVAGISIQTTDLRGPAGAIIPGDAAEVYRQHQFELTVPSNRNDKFRLGWYPDALVPSLHPLTHQPLVNARFSAMPFDLPANQTHGFWIDLNIPADARPGEYRGSCRLTAQGGKSVEVPITLTVFDFSLPLTPTLQTAFGAPAQSLRAYYRRLARDGKEKDLADWPAVETQCNDLLSRHRFAATPPAGTFVPQAQSDGSFRIPAEQITAFRDFIDRYHINAFQTIHPSNVVKDPVAEKTKLHAWLKAFDIAARELNRPAVVLFIYLKDEPNDLEAYQYVQKWGKAIKEAKSIVKVMVVEQTQTQDAKWGDLYGAVDIWCPLFPLFDPENAAKRQALGEPIWTYTALCQIKPTPWWEIDFPLLNYRAPAWIAWRYHMTGLLYWGSMSYWTQVADPWIDPKTYDRRQREGKAALWNGEGTLVYPARPVGYDGIAPSLRLKALRDSIEDYEYLAILERMGMAEQARKIVLPLASSFFDWEKNPAAYDPAREQLGKLIASSDQRPK